MTHHIIGELQRKFSEMGNLQGDALYNKLDTLRSDTAKIKTRLFENLLDQEQLNPAKLDKDQIDKFHDLEIASAYLRVNNPNESAGKNIIENAINWKTPTGQPSLAAHFRHALATATDNDPFDENYGSPKARTLGVTVSYTR